MYAFNQAVFSLNFGLGGWVTLSTYNKFRRNYLWDVIVFNVFNVIWSMLSAVTVFGFTAYLVAQNGGDLLGYLENGVGYSVLIIPEVALTLDYPQAWAVLFFLLLLLTTFGTLIVVTENVVSAIGDVLHDYHKSYKRVILVGIICAVLFAFGIFLCTDAGAFVIILLQEFISARNLSIIILCKVLILSLVYGYKNFLQDIDCMLGKQSFYLRTWFAASWLLIIPIALLAFFLWWVIDYLIDYEDVEFLGFTYPIHWTILGWILAWFPILVMVIFSIWLMCTQFSQEVQETRRE
jgi:SNF family Na+-dependent transporter